MTMRDEWEMTPAGLAYWCENKAKGHASWAKRKDTQYEGQNREWLAAGRRQSARTAERYRIIARLLRELDKAADQ